MKAFVCQKLMSRTYSCVRKFGRSYSRSIVGIAGGMMFLVHAVTCEGTKSPKDSFLIRERAKKHRRLDIDMIGKEKTERMHHHQ